MKVYFIGAGPGAGDLITIRGARALGKVSLVLYAGSLVPPALLEHCRPDADIINTAGPNLEEQIGHYLHAQANYFDVARLHSGDPAIYGATGEQIQELKKHGIDYEIIPGVSSFTAAAAELGLELTRPTISQTIILTRVSGRASAVPELESIDKLAYHQATLCIFLSGPHLRKIVDDLMQHYAESTPVALVYRATWEDQRTHKSTLGKVLEEVAVDDWKLTTMLLVGAVLDDEIEAASKLYAADYSHKFRKARVPVQS